MGVYVLKCYDHAYDFMTVAAAVGGPSINIIIEQKCLKSSTCFAEIMKEPTEKNYCLY